MPIQVGSICVFTSGVVLNVVFAVSFRKQIIKEKGGDKEFDRWRKKKWISSNCFFFLASTVSLTLYRLIYCRLFRIEVLCIRVSKPKRFYRPIFIFTCLKLLVFNLPLVIVDLVGISYLSWGNQVYMTMVESMTLSFLQLFLLAWEKKNEDQLFDREGGGISLDKLQTQVEGDME